ncbi:MAG TPA: hypothetical protein DIW31_09840 [Bacteroidales bacterium]|nr:hypothetical protein [Bacteroidales bacterium]
MKLSYDKNSIEAVLENLEAGTGESIAFAVELIDTFVEEDIKPYIVPLLEDNSISNKIWALQNYFPLRELDPDGLLKAVINRDNNLIGKQAKIYALNAFPYLENFSISADLVAQMFNTDKILRQISAQLIEQIDSSQYLKAKKRLGDKLRVELDRQLNNLNVTGLSANDKINFYKTCFKGTAEEEDILFMLYQANVLKLSNQNIFDLEVFKDRAYVIFIETGTIKLYNGVKNERDFGIGESLNTVGFKNQSYKLIPEQGTIIHYIDYEKIINSIYDYDFLIKYINKQPINL